MSAIELNFDGLVGPTHNYAGLAHGNLASAKNKGKVSNPKAAALQGLEKMRLLHDLGLKQAVLPPHLRPDIGALRRLGFAGNDADVMEAAWKNAPHLLAACSSASAMWTANAATVSPSADTADGRVHFTPANLICQFHRSLETPFTARLLKAIFADRRSFVHHNPLPAIWPTSDEGAANHMRLASSHASAGLEVFVYGRESKMGRKGSSRRFFPRQSMEASRQIARAHALGDGSLLICQSRRAIDAGAFHNDVVAVANLNVLLYHAQAWDDSPHAIGRIRWRLRRLGVEMVAIKIDEREMSLSDAVSSYLFNSQIVSLPEGGMALIAPLECRRVASARRFLQKLPGLDTPIRKVLYVPVRQSMRNGGGPACLRLRVPLTEREYSHVHSGVIFTPMLHNRLVKWVNRHYRDQLHPRELADPKLLVESRTSLDELSRILRLHQLYENP